MQCPTSATHSPLQCSGAGWSSLSGWAQCPSRRPEACWPACQWTLGFPGWVCPVISPQLPRPVRRWFATSEHGSLCSKKKKKREGGGFKPLLWWDYDCGFPSEFLLNIKFYTKILYKFCKDLYRTYVHDEDMHETRSHQKLMFNSEFVYTPRWGGHRITSKD